jgi:pimeloyl-ACP methyl ester carboxylesterase
MIERIVQFGDGGALSGVFHAPPVQHVAGPALLLFNAGVVHRIGAHRLNVKIARALGVKEIPSLRFDLSGLGESAPQNAGRGYEAQAAADVSAATDILAAEWPSRQIIALGMCSGADNSYRAALKDERVEGLILLDPFAYPNNAAAAADILARASDPERWARKAASLLAPKAASEQTADQDDLDQSRPVPPRETFGADLQRLTERGVRILILYTGFVRALVSKPAHFFSTFSEFDFKGRLEVVATPDADHTYTELAAQAALIDRIDNWLARQFPVRDAAG